MFTVFLLWMELIKRSSLIAVKGWDFFINKVVKVHLHPIWLWLFTLTSACLVPLLQSHTDSMCSLESSITHKNAPESCKRAQQIRTSQNKHVNLQQTCRRHHSHFSFSHNAVVIHFFLCMLHYSQWKSTLPVFFTEKAYQKKERLIKMNSCTGSDWK